LSLKIFYDSTAYRVQRWRKINKLLEKVIAKEGRISGDLNFIITGDEELKRLNIQFLEHDYYTDVITFDYSEGNVINGEVYISIDRVKENARNYNVSFKSEIRRVIIHGVLHLTGYDDKTEEEKSEMRRLESYWMSLIEE